jgi:hypothetical protein
VTNRKVEYWVIPPESDAEFAAGMEEVLVRRIELRHTPKHGSWLNIAENELSSLTRRCVAGRRFGNVDPSFERCSQTHRRTPPVDSGNDSSITRRSFEMSAGNAGRLTTTVENKLLGAATGFCIDRLQSPAVALY